LQLPAQLQLLKLALSSSWWGDRATQLKAIVGLLLQETRTQSCAMKNERAVSTALLIFFTISLPLSSTACNQGNENPSASKQTDALRPTNQWFTLAPNIDEFSVEIPGLTTSITQATPNTYLYKDQGKVYLLIVFPLLDDNEKLADEEVLGSYGKTFSKSVLEGFNLSEPPPAKHLMLNGISGLEYRVSDGQRIRDCRLYLRKKRIYSLEGIVPVSEAASVERFLHSFTFEREKPLQFLQGNAKDSSVPYGDPK
jgi:hypothetical protein